MLIMGVKQKASAALISNRILQLVLNKEAEVTSCL